MRRILFAVALLAPASALAEPLVLAQRRITVDTPVEAFVAPHAPISKVIYLERCRGGCTVTKSNTNDALAGLSTIPQSAGTKTITEFQNFEGESGAAADAEWDLVVQCVREVYSPFDVTVTDVRPTSGTFHMAVIAGFPSELGFGNDILGVAPLASNCSAIDNVMSFSFANAHGPTFRINNLCWTAAQESAHAFGLDHTFKFIDGRSTCNDPMTYQVDCGGQRFFRNHTAKCGEFEERSCRCGATQNSHKKLLDTFGAGTPITGNPTSVITMPVDDDPLGPSIGALAGSRRGVAKVELLVNGFPWVEVKGAGFAGGGQPNPAAYALQLPSTLPDGICDFSVRASDDLGAFTDSPLVTRTKGQPCVDASTCAEGQFCEAGKCMWGPPTGEVGDACEYPQFCKSLECIGEEGDQICSQECNPNIENTCPGELSCIETGPDMGLCYFESGGGCCSVSRGRVPWAQLCVSALVFGLVMRRRRRR